MDHATRAVLAQRQVCGASEEVPGFRPLLAGLDLAAEFLVTDEQARYLSGAKANQPTLLARLKRLPWHRVPVADGATMPDPDLEMQLASCPLSCAFG